MLSVAFPGTSTLGFSLPMSAPPIMLSQYEKTNRTHHLQPASYYIPPMTCGGYCRNYYYDCYVYGHYCDYDYDYCYLLATNY